LQNYTIVIKHKHVIRLSAVRVCWYWCPLWL